MLLSILLLLVCCALVKGQGFDVNNGVLYVNIQIGGSPNYTFYDIEFPERKYLLNFVELYECRGRGYDCSRVPGSSVDLTAQQWIGVTVAETSEDILFKDSAVTLPGRYFRIDIKNLLLKNADKRSIKFDLKVFNYRWVSNASDNNLVLRFRYTNFGEGVRYGFVRTNEGAYYQLEEETGPVEVVFIGNRQHRDFRYRKFPYLATMYHDPVYGTLVSLDSTFQPCLLLLFILTWIIH